MKLTTAVAALLMVSTVAFGSHPIAKDKKSTSAKVAVVQKADQKFKLVYFDKIHGEVIVNIKNRLGNVVYSQAVLSEGGFAQSYNFSKLPKGTYTFEVVQPNGERLKKKVEYKEPVRTPSIKANLLSVSDDKKYRLAVLKYNAEPVKVRIFNQTNDLVHIETIDSAESFRKMYDLGKLDGESFRFDLINSDNTVSLVTE